MSQDMRDRIECGEFDTAIPRPEYPSVSGDVPAYNEAYHHYSEAKEVSMARFEHEAMASLGLSHHPKAHEIFQYVRGIVRCGQTTHYDRNTLISIYDELSDIASLICVDGER